MSAATAAAKSLQSQTAAHQAPPSLGFSRQEHWSGLLFPSPMHERKSESEVIQSCPTLSNPMDCSLPGSSVHGILQARILFPVVMYACESWTELWGWRTLESPLDCKEIQPVHSKGDQSWVFIGRTDIEAETQMS